MEALNRVSLDYAKEHAKPGWLIQYRGNGWFSPFVRLATSQVHTHTALVTNANEVSEVREFVGGRITDFNFQYAKHRGRMDFFSIREEFYNPAGVYKTVLVMRTMASECKYDWPSIALIALRKLPLFHLLFEPGEFEGLEPVDRCRRHCSSAVAAAFQAGLIDPVPNWPNRLVTPGDLTRSLLYVYRFTM